MTYKQFKEANAMVRRKGNYSPVTIAQVIISPASVQMDSVLFTHGQSIKIDGLLNNVVTFQYNYVTNASKLANWRGFDK